MWIDPLAMKVCLRRRCICKSQRLVDDIEGHSARKKLSRSDLWRVIIRILDLRNDRHAQKLCKGLLRWVIIPIGFTTAKDNPLM